MKLMSPGEKVFMAVTYVILALLACSTVYPLIYVFSASISAADEVVSGSVLLWPKDVTLQAYRQVVAEDGIWIAYANTVYYTVVGTAVSMVMTIMGAYPLSKARLRGRSAISFYIAFTMLFSAGMIPLYLTIRDLHLLDTRMALILPFAISTFLVILLRTFFQSVPIEMEEAAKIDGASDWRVLASIYLPMSKPALATMTLFYAVGRWNSYFWAMVLIKNPDKIPLQVLLQKLVVQMTPTESMMASQDLTEVFSKETVIYATIIVSILPIIAVYPFIQKYFTQGLMVGSVKG